MAGLEAVGVRGLAELLLLAEVGTDVVELSLDLGVVGREAREAREGGGGSIVTALLDQEARRLQKRVSTASQLMSLRHIPRGARACRR